MDKVTRRAAIVAAAVSSAAVAVAAVPAIAEPDPDAALLALGAELLAIRQTWDARAEAHYAVYPDDIAYDVCEQPEADLEAAIEAQIMATPARSPRGLLFKVLINSGFGDFPLDDLLVAEIIGMTGFRPEPSHPRHPDFKRA
jgi:hypothetical protein